MAYEHILVENEEGVAVLTMDRPEVLNAMNHTLVSELHDAVMAANADENIGCIVITGAGQKAFSAGGDIHEQREDARNRTEEERDVRSAEHSQFMYDISSSPKPVIGMMNGLAYGGGAVLASCLDIRVGCENTKFRFLATAYGRINCTWTLPNQVGWPKAKELLFTARIVEAEEAFQIGLLNHLVPADELRAKFDGLVGPYLPPARVDELATRLLSIHKEDDINEVLRLTRPLSAEVPAEAVAAGE